MFVFKWAWKHLIHWLLLSLLLVSSPVFAQSGKGSLSGRVADAAGAALQGAQVELLPSAGTVTTNRQREFTITNLAPGTYTVMISYVGFEPFIQEVTIAPGKNTQLRALIKVQGKSEEVMVLNMSGTEPVANHPEWASDFSDPHYYGGTYRYGTNQVDYSKVRAWANASGLGYCVSQPAPNSVTWGCSDRLNTGNFDLVERISVTR